MAYIPLRLPPGVWRNGTKYQSKGRWYDCNLVRWIGKGDRPVAMPVGGWENVQITNPSIANINVSDPIRGLFGWRDNTENPWLCYGTYNKAYAFSEGVQTEITPAGFTAGGASAVSATGVYNTGNYGDMYYGTGDPAQETLVEANTWQFDNFGEYLIALAYSDGKIYYWDLNTGNDLTQVAATSPIGALGVVVTPERFVVALGGYISGVHSAATARRVMWSDQEDYTTWVDPGDGTTQAGDFELPGAGQLMTGRRGRNETLLWTDRDLFAMRYIGGTLVYNFTTLGNQCGIISRMAVAMVDNRAVWMGHHGFYIYDGFVQPMPCDVEDYVFNDMNRMQASKICAVSIAEQNEVWFFYPSAGSDENDRYVIFNYARGDFAIGQLQRTSGIDRGAFQYPMMADASGRVYDHERGGVYLDVDDSTALSPYVESGPVELADGDHVMFMRDYIPDDQTIGDANLTVYTSFYPGGTEASEAFNVSTQTSLRKTGRWIRLKLDQDTPADSGWRIGMPRIDVRPGGLR